ncbi:hypothetical protein RRG08_041583 [Elysia crispata]|uniref:Uncharacterized protein n=1 Tax=Elysia crispata TaxID=231223 RepID=A0AAE1AYL1_9GAST|nr:hypothetical protein RRG08_041583 [Elysia crispata]
MGEGQDKTRNTSQPSNAAEEVLGHDGSPVPLVLGFLGRESGIAPVQRLSHLKKRPTLCATHSPPQTTTASPAAIGDKRSNRWRWPLAVVALNLHMEVIVAHFLTSGTTEYSAFPGRLSSPF